MFLSPNTEPQSREYMTGTILKSVIAYPRPFLPTGVLRR